MNRSRKFIQWTHIGLACLALTGCGGGGGGSPAADEASLSKQTQAAAKSESTVPTISASVVVPGSGSGPVRAPVVVAVTAPLLPAPLVVSIPVVVPAPLVVTAPTAPLVPATRIPTGMTPEEEDLAVARAGLDITQPVAKTGTKAQQRVGANLGGVSDYAATREFVDLVMQCRGLSLPAAPWSATPKSTTATPKVISTPVELDANDGWPLEDFGMVLMTGQENAVGLGGIYTIKYKGPPNARVDAIAGTPGTVGNHVYNNVTQQHSWQFAFPEGGKQMFLSFTGTQGVVTDVKVIRPGYDVDSPPVYTREFLTHLNRFSALRFMDWTYTNSPDVATTWAKRPTIHGKRCAGQVGMAPGMPWERAIQLANITGSDMWVNIPLNATDDYVRQLARLIKKTLAPNLKVYVEYSNEVWNSGFVALHGNKDAALAALQASPKVTRIDYDGQTSQWFLAYRYFAEQTMRVSNLFRAELPDQMMTRIRPVLAWQAAGGAGYVDDMLTFLTEAYGKLPNQYFYAYAGAPYYNLGDKQAVDGLSTDQVLTAMELRMPNVPTSYQYERNVGTAKKFGLEMIAYEGGPDTASLTGGSLDSKAAANRSPRMLNMCKTYLDDWAKRGGGLFMWFQAGAGSWDSKYGSWPLAESMIGAEGPKLQCLTWAANTPAPLLTMRHMKGVAFDTAEAIDGDSTTARLWWRQAAPAKQLARTWVIGDRTGGCYPLTLGTRFDDPVSPSFEVWVNGIKALDIASLPKSDTTVNTNMGQVCLKQGANALVIKNITITNNAYIDTIQVGNP